MCVGVCVCLSVCGGEGLPDFRNLGLPCFFLPSFLPPPFSFFLFFFLSFFLSLSFSLSSFLISLSLFLSAAGMAYGSSQASG